MISIFEKSPLLILLLLTLQLHAQPCFEENQPIAEQRNACEQLVPKDLNQPATDAELKAALKLLEILTQQANFDQALGLVKRMQSQNLSGEQQFQFSRRVGIVHYRQGNRLLALQWFQRAQQQADALGSDQFLAIALADLGTTHLAMMQYPEALRHFRQSLTLKQQGGSELSQAVTLNNIGSLYRKMADFAAAIPYFEQAIAIYQKNNKADRVSHTQEELGLVYLEQGNAQQALQIFLQVLQEYQKHPDAAGQLRAELLCARAALALNNLEDAEQHLSIASALDLQLGASAQTVSLKLYAGNLLSQQDRYQQADAMLLTGLQLANQQADPEHQQAFLLALIDNARKFLQWQAVADYQQQLNDFQQQRFKTELAQYLAEQRSLLDFEQQQKQLHDLSKDNQIKKLQIDVQRHQLGLLMLASVVFLLLAGAFSWRQRQQRLLARQQLQDEIEFHRQQVQQLGADHDSLKAAFGQLDMPLMVFGNHQQLMFSNDACAKLLGTEPITLATLRLDQLIAPTHQEFWQAWQQEMPIEQCQIELEDWLFAGRHYQLSLQINALQREEQLIVVVFSPQKSQFPSLAPDNQSFSQQLVDLMLSSLAAWEESTSSSRIELAEKSGIWRVSVDDGRIRTRSLDRYLSMKTLPKNPRWREVLRTAHFVLASCPLSTGRKDEISEKLARLTQQIRANSL